MSIYTAQGACVLLSKSTLPIDERWHDTRNDSARVLNTSNNNKEGEHRSLAAECLLMEESGSSPIVPQRSVT